MSTRTSRTQSIVTQAKEETAAEEEQEGDTDVDLEEIDVQEILLSYKESRQLRGEQRVYHGYRPVTRRTTDGKAIPR